MGGYLCGASTTLMVALGDSLGLFRYMSGKSPASSKEIASGTGLHERYVREMLYQLVCTSLHLLLAISIVTTCVVTVITTVSPADREMLNLWV